MSRLASVVTIAALVAGALTAATPALAASRHFSERPGYYLSLGDSLSVGIQPNSAGVDTPTSQGYVNDLYAKLAAADHRLHLVQLGCSGETTGTLINGGICTYRGDRELSPVGTGHPAGSQLAAAVAFLHRHRHVSLITIDIGANDLNPCVVLPPSQIQACLAQVLPQIAANLSTIMTALRAAGGDEVRIIGMRYYVPELAAWLTGPAGQTTAQLSVALAEQFNNVLASGFQAADARVADVFTAFDSADFTDQVTLPGIGTVPQNVANICLWTWECVPPPQGPNEHANATGYAVIAQAFLAADQ
ncbi:MAG TPA: SGNH/GDSL hydrolase family protein [Streptosporangiaceae bacterium]